MIDDRNYMKMRMLIYFIVVFDKEILYQAWHKNQNNLYQKLQ